MPSAAVVLYDRDCKLCNRSVQFLRARQKPAALSYVALQSDRGKTILKDCGLSKTRVETLVLREDDRCYQRSTAVLRAVRHLRPPWPALFFLIVVPRFIRDPIYNLVAHNRYRWFGRTPRG